MTLHDLVRLIRSWPITGCSWPATLQWVRGVGHGSRGCRRVLSLCQQMVDWRMPTPDARYRIEEDFYLLEWRHREAVTGMLEMAIVSVCGPEKTSGINIVMEGLRFNGVLEW